MEWLEASFEDGTDKLAAMNARVDHLLDEALALGPDERSALVVALMDSLDGEDEATVTKAWADEIRRRKAELRSGTASAVTWAEARARLTAL
jgi:putative addiction module component (TIGR02574 family)